MDFGANIKPVEIFKEGAMGVSNLKTFILVLVDSGTKSHGKNLIS